MPHDDAITFDDSFHQADFLDSIQYIPTALADVPIDQEVLTFHGEYDTPMSQLSPNVVKDFTGIFQTYYPSGSEHSFNTLILEEFQSYVAGKSYTDWTTFKDGWYDKMVTFFANSLNISNSQADALIDEKFLYQGLLYDYASSLGTQIDPNTGLVLQGDWEILTDPPDPLPLSFLDQDSSSNPFVQAFNHFMGDYDFTAPPNTTDLYGDVWTFVDQYHAFLSTTAHMQVPSESYTSPDNPGFFDEISSYEQIFFAFSPSTATHADFVAAMKQFYQDTVTAAGYFMPGHFYPQWIDTIRLVNQAALPLMSQSSLSGNSSIKILIIDRILKLIIKIITTLQNVGIEQANRLSFTTQYQQVYTGLQNQIPVFLKGDDGDIGSGSTDASQARNDLNSSFNGALTDNLRALRSLEEDRAKTQQSDVSTTNDAVNQQTDMATSFIQQMSSILGAIFR